MASPAYLEARGQPDVPQDLEAHQVVHDDNLRGGPRWPFVVDGQQRRVEVKAALSVNSARAVHDLAVAGAGIALLPRFAATASLREGKLQQVLAEHGSPAFPIHLLFPHAHLLTARVRSFAQHLTNALRAVDL